MVAMFAGAIAVGMELSQTDLHWIPPLSTGYGTAGVHASLRTDPGVEWTAGVRLPPDVAEPLAAAALAEIHASAALAPEIGPWVPAVGLEVGWTAFTGIRSDHPGLLRAIENGALPAFRLDDFPAFGPLYAAVTSAPLRFRLGPATLSALDLAIGTPLAVPGQVLRVQLTWVRFAWTF